jgi:squalene synthase HpnC
VSVDHYENFPVASILCPPRLRPAIAAVYAFARTADDIADEGDAGPVERLADLAAFRDDLQAVAAGGTVSARWPRVFEPLRAVLRDHRLPTPLLLDLLSAFEQDVVQHRYRDRAQLLDYCRRSANPIGRLLLHLYGVNASASLRQSDAICTALQLANFWQDLRVDTERDRIYLPATDCARRGVCEQELIAQRDGPALRTLVADMVAWTRALMHDGAPLVHAIPGRAGWELRLVVQGGLRILEKIDRLDHATMLSRPKLRRSDAPVLLWRALRMRAGALPGNGAMA